MPIYHVSGSPAAAATGAPIATFHTGSTRIAHILEIRLFNATAVASNIGLIKPANSPAASTSIVPVAGDQAVTLAAASNLDTAWTTAPTITSNVYLRKSSLANVQGASDVWQFAYGELSIAVSTYIVLWNYGSGTSGQVDVTIKYEE